MRSEAELEPLERVARFQPAEILTKAQSLRQRSLQCTELAGTSVTADAKQVLSNMAADLGREAEQLEHALEAIRRRYAQDVADDHTSLVIDRVD